ncbi:MAG: GNAT family N-acetyltransferase [Clostridia bacterium]|nr:GNAT family N-acetyltransferase [Clostridia bacterium]
MIHLEKIDAVNVWDVRELKVKQAQKGFVASNDISLIQAFTSSGTGCSAFPFAIYNDKRLVGFLMIGYNEAALYELFGEEPPKSLINNYSLWRLMIDKRYQNRGYGREAVKLALEFVRSFPCGRAEYCEVSFEPENTVARDLYRSFGFVENGEMDGDETVAVLKL